MIDFSELKLNNKDPVYTQIAMFIKRKILLKQVEAGDILPSRRELAIKLEINPNTAQKAYKLMEEEGYVYTCGNNGSRIYVNEYIYRKIEEELRKTMTKEFIKLAKNINLSFKEVVDLINEMWDEV
ncbi:DNA-binding transcriptional regulator YhcF (GntR family) [Natranaerovirga pectinivora]|uniref:DNA-binding transcriptional regulator YhcF (GntR family) n=1 Tax=Natranaerovirga pectinivora TaxID=682400 RepID=A0A4R3ML06_9FIRM|nr:GntR family transcriptional regulator [Natranaerovirga pectinivora]TCT13120.1 DNA-binding transcriptional regulator YhcF (GntR family) [Natranaerovirga pectinivora]